MTTNLTDPANHPANSPLTGERIERVIEALESSLKYRNGSSMGHFIADAVKGLRELREGREAVPVAIVEPSDYVTSAQLVGDGPARKAVYELFEGALCVGDKLYRHPRPEEGKSTTCPKCNGTGMADSGGVQPWGEPISIVCDCTAQPAPVVPEDVSGPLAHAYKELTPTFMRNHIAVFERYGIAPKDSSTVIQALRIALDGIERRAAMLQESPKGAGAPQNCSSSEKVQVVREQSGTSPVSPDGWVMVPMRLTAENGAKGVLSGEFSETKFINCPECFGDDDCETCDGSGRIEITVPVTWTNIKAIWAKGVEHFAAAPQQEVK